MFQPPLTIRNHKVAIINHYESLYCYQSLLTIIDNIWQLL